MSGVRPAEAWLARLRAQADAPPLAQRMALWWGHHRIGSVEPEVAAVVHLPLLRHERDGWRLHGDVSSGLAQVAQALRDAGRVRAWRGEQLAVTDEDGAVLGTVERGLVRLLGITSHAVHLLGVGDDGRHWVQQRAMSKSDDPGKWDTLVGGMVPAGESAEAALGRETGEEAGLQLGQLGALQYGGHVMTRRPSAAQPGGYIVERLDWYRCVVPQGVMPVNRDGEVAQFAQLAPAQLCAALERDEFTVDAALMLVAAGL